MFIQTFFHPGSWSPDTNQQNENPSIVLKMKIPSWQVQPEGDHKFPKIVNYEQVVQEKICVSLQKI